MKLGSKCSGAARRASARRGPLRPALIAFCSMLPAMFPTMFLMSACQSYVQQQQAERKVNVEQDHLRLMVYTSDLTAPYEKLGELSYTDPLNGETIASDHINEKLRQMAIDRWGPQVDAIILVTTKVGSMGPAGRRDYPCNHQGRRR